MKKEEEDDERVAVIDTGMFSVKVRLFKFIALNIYSFTYVHTYMYDTHSVCLHYHFELRVLLVHACVL